MTTTATPRPLGVAAAPPPVAAPVPAPRAPYAVVGRSRNEGHGKRLTAAFEALEVFPALAESRDRLLALITEERPSTGDVVRAIESDVALVIAVCGAAGREATLAAGGVIEGVSGGSWGGRSRVGMDTLLTVYRHPWTHG